MICKKCDGYKWYVKEQKGELQLFCANCMDNKEPAVLDKNCFVFQLNLLH